MTAEDSTRRTDRRDRSLVLQECVDATLGHIRRLVPPESIFALPNAGLLLTNAYFLISDAYKLRRGMQESRTHIYKVAAFTAAAIMAVRPIRVSDTSNVVHIAVAQANQQCAMRAAQALLGLDLERLDPDFLRRMYSSVFSLVDMPCLTTYLRAFDDRFSKSPATFEQIETAIPFDDFNNMQFSSDELSIVEMLVNQFETLEKANGHPFMRILLGWRWRWS